MIPFLIAAQRHNVRLPQLTSVFSEDSYHMRPTLRFLEDPQSVRQSLIGGLGRARSLDAAVAFVGRDWRDIKGTFYFIRGTHWVQVIG